MKWLKRLVVALVLLIVAVGTIAIATARRTDNPVGLQMARVEGPAGPFAVALLYPTTARPMPAVFAGGSLVNIARNGPIAGEHLPVILLSHGNGGSALAHIDLAMELASAGYIVAAPTHPGDNFADQSRQGAPDLFSTRAGELRATLDYVLKAWPGASHVDADRVGAYGMSAGAFTVLTLAGATPRMDAIPEHCRRDPEFICKAFAHVHSPLLTDAAKAGSFSADARIKAVVIAAPGLGFTFAPDGLADVHVPVQLWSGDKDDTVPFASNAGIVQAGLGDRVEAHRVAGASHMSFLAPCGLLKAPGVCTDPDGFDRAAAHATMNAEVMRFFAAHLPPQAAAGTAKTAVH